MPGQEQARKGIEETLWILEERKSAVDLVEDLLGIVIMYRHCQGRAKPS